MGQAINVKVPTARIIKALENKLTENTKNLKENERLEKEHKAKLDEFYKKVLKEITPKMRVQQVRTCWNNRVEVTYETTKDIKIPDEPRNESKRVLGNYEVDEIENAIRILKMSDEQFVNASTMKSISRYL